MKTNEKRQAVRQKLFAARTLAMLVTCLFALSTLFALPVLAGGSGVEEPEEWVAFGPGAEAVLPLSGEVTFTFLSPMNTAAGTVAILEWDGTDGDPDGSGVYGLGSVSPAASHTASWDTAGLALTVAYSGLAPNTVYSIQLDQFETAASLLKPAALFMFTTSAGPVVSALSLSATALESDGGMVTATLSGTELSYSTVQFALFDGTVNTGVSATATGTATEQAAALAIPPNTSITDAKVYTVKATLDGGASWQSQTADITVSKAPSYTLIIPPNVVGQAGEGVTMTFEGDLTKMVGLVLNGVQLVLDPPAPTAATQQVDLYLPDGTYVGYATRGSVIISVSGSYIDTLPDGDNALEIQYSDGSAFANIVIDRETDSSVPSAPSTQPPSSQPGTSLVESAVTASRVLAAAPQTGSVATGLWVFVSVVALGMLAGVVLVFLRRNKTDGTGSA